MASLEDLYENGQLSLCLTSKATSAKQRFAIHPSMLHATPVLNSTAMRKDFPKELTTHLGTEGQAYILKSPLEEYKKKTSSEPPPMLGRRIIHGTMRWGPNFLKIPGEFAYFPRYWEWTEDIIARCATRLKDASIYDAVYASLFPYDREAHVIRAFCESWCSQTNTLHTEAGEWSISLWDLHKLGGLPIFGHPYDETIPSFKAMNSLNHDGSRLISRSCERLFDAYCLLADESGLKNGVRAAQ